MVGERKRQFVKQQIRLKGELTNVGRKRLQRRHNESCNDITKVTGLELAKILKSVGVKARERVLAQHKEHGLPLIYELDGNLVKEYADGLIVPFDAIPELAE